MSAENVKWSRQVDYEDLEVLAQQMGDDAANIFDEHLAAGGELIDIEFELQHPDIMVYATMLTRVLFGCEPSEDAKKTAYRAAHFAYLISEQFVQHPGIATSHYFGKDETMEDLQLRIFEDTQGYMQHRPMLDALIGRYMPEIDPSMRYAPLAETVSALVFIQIEIGEKNKFKENRTQAFVAELALWNDDLAVFDS
jgi:hypothetical protein